MAFSPADLVTTVQLARQVRRRFVDAPGQYKVVWDNVKSLSFLLEEVDDLLPHRKLSAPREEDLQIIWKSCSDVLNDLSLQLEKFTDLDPSARTRNGKVRIAWKQLHWKQSDFDDLQSRLMSIVSAFNAFLTFLNSDVTCEIKAGVDRLNAREDAQVAEQNRQSLLDWLGDADYITHQQAILATRQNGTGQWFLCSEEFLHWVNVDKTTMLCSGILGAGKTILASVIVNHLQTTLQDDLKVGIVYFYFSYRSPATQTLEAVLGSLVRQLLQNQLNIPATILDIYQRHLNNKSRPSLEELRRASRAAIEMHTKVFVVLDALDEYHTCNSSALFATITELFSLQDTTRINFLATTRKISDITSRFPVSRCIWKEIRAHAEDIDAYINARMPELLGGRIEEHPDLQTQVRTTISGAADGMFLLVRLHMDTLRGPRRPATLLRVLQNLPRGFEGLDETYGQAMERIEAQSEDARNLATSIIAWVVHAKSTLSVRELMEALAIEPETARLDQDMRPDPRDIDSLCAGLITVDHNTEAVRLVHQSAQEYFLRHKHFPNAQEKIMNACLTYLSYDYFDEGTIEEGVENRFWFYCFYKYAASYWGFHAKSVDHADEMILSFLLGSPKKVSEYIQAAFWREYPYHWHTLDHKTVLGVHIVAYLGLHWLFEPLIRAGQSANLEDSEGRSPLCYAASRGQYEVVEYLTRVQRVDVNHESKSNGTALCIAAAAGHIAVVQELIRCGTIDYNATTREGESPLILAVVNNHIDVVVLLLSSGKTNLNAYTNVGLSAFMLAVQGKNMTIIKYLLSQDTLNYRAKSPTTGYTALKWAANNAGLQIICQKYIEDGQVRDPCEVRSLLLRAVECGLLDVTQKILFHKDFDQILLHSEELGGLLYRAAASSGHLRLLDLLLSTFDVDVDVVDADGKTALFFAAENGHVEVMSLLVSTYGADPNRMDTSEGVTPLIQTAREDHRNAAELLLFDYRVDPNAGEGPGWTALTFAAHFGSVEVLELLLTKFEVDVDLKDIDGRTPLSYAADRPKMLMKLTEKTLNQIIAHPKTNAELLNVEQYAQMWFALFSHIPKSVHCFLENGYFESGPDISDEVTTQTSMRADTERLFEKTDAEQTIRALIQAKLVTTCPRCREIFTQLQALLFEKKSSIRQLEHESSDSLFHEAFSVLNNLSSSASTLDISRLKDLLEGAGQERTHRHEHLWNYIAKYLEFNQKEENHLNESVSRNDHEEVHQGAKGRTLDRERFLSYATRVTDRSLDHFSNSLDYSCHDLTRDTINATIMQLQMCKVFDPYAARILHRARWTKNDEGID
ncbi:hypothetical protein BKA66DRAFT_608522 [Pyrenochaeta sp. MPI-SDFR-AT-0127]|nr:hypothetical protein BKA66DRAFT_608522 [Pyrenochaeta sp. MPI-SDFR-AT-0127]